MNTTPTFDEVGVLYLQNYFQKEELPMCNPTDNLVRYPFPYKVVDGCLCQETTTLSGDNQAEQTDDREALQLHSVHRQRGVV